MTTPQDRARELLSSETARAVWCAAFAAVGTQHPWAAMCRVLDLHGITNRYTYADEVALAAAMHEHMRSRADAPAACEGMTLGEARDQALSQLRAQELRIAQAQLVEARAECAATTRERDAARLGYDELRGAYDAARAELAAANAARNEADGAYRAVLAQLERERAELAAAVADRDSVNRQLTEDHDYSYALERQLRTLKTLATTLCDAVAAVRNLSPKSRPAGAERALDVATEQLRAAADAALSDPPGEQALPRAAREQQRTVARILAAWQRVPELRLGQFIANAIHPAVDTFHVEDETLALQCEEYAQQATGRGEREGE